MKQITLKSQVLIIYFQRCASLYFISKLDPIQLSIDWPEKSHLNELDTNINSVLGGKVHVFSKRYTSSCFPFSHLQVLIYLERLDSSVG